MSAAIALFTRDLRVHDNPVLDAASAGRNAVVPLFVFDDTMLAETAHRSPHRFGFLCESLVDLDSSLRDRGGALFVRRRIWTQEVLRIAYEARCAGDPRRTRRRGNTHNGDSPACKTPRPQCVVVLHDSLTIVPFDALGKPYVVFTPYYKRWLAEPWRGRHVSPALLLFRPRRVRERSPTKRRPANGMVAKPQPGRS